MLAYNNWVFVSPDTTWLTFDVRACSQAHILITTELASPDAGPGVEVVLSTTEKSDTFIWSSQYGIVANISADPTLLSCHESRLVSY